MGFLQKPIWNGGSSIDKRNCCEAEMLFACRLLRELSLVRLCSQREGVL